ncbi:MAG: SGNH/GDSL hydrolase family protein [Actinomycetota bacterium]
MRIAKGLVGLAVVLGVIAAGMPASSAGTRYGGSAYYLALGDSLAAGFQPGQGDTEAGYVHDLWATFGEQIPGLGLRNVGCDGETTRSMLTGTRSECHYAAGSQLDAAVAFLEGHPGQVAFITIDIGSNDVFERCLADGPLLKRSCVRGVLPHVQTRLARILDALAAAAGPGVPIVAMTYYDPLLGFWGLVPSGRFLARASLRSFEALNAGLTTTYGDAGVAVADVAGTFRIDDFADTIVVAGRGPLPANVALTCRWTWFCSPRFAGDPHPNDKGYRRIAHTIEGVVEALLPT